MSAFDPKAGTNSLARGDLETAGVRGMSARPVDRVGNFDRTLVIGRRGNQAAARLPFAAIFVRNGIRATSQDDSHLRGAGRTSPRSGSRGFSLTASIRAG